MNTVSPAIQLSRAALAAMLLACPACGGEPAGSDAGAKLADSAARQPPASAAPAASAAPTAAEVKPGVRAFAGDDPGKTVKLTGARAWTVGPGDTWSIGLYDYVRADGTKNIFKVYAGEEEFAVAGAFTAEVSEVASKAWKKGDPVLVAPAKEAECGRVASVSGDDVTVAFEFAQNVETKAAPRRNLLPLTGKLELGAPVAYKQKAADDAWRPSFFIHGDDKDATLSGKKRVPLDLVRVVDVKRIFAKNDKVWAATLDTKGVFQPATVEQVIDGGVRYAVKYEDGKKGFAKFCRVIAPIK